MNRRLALGVLVVLALVGLAGCSMIFGGISDEELDREQEYDDLKDRNADVAIDIDDAGLLSGSEYRVVYDLEDTEELSMYQSSLYRDRALDIHSVRYWYPNGTEMTGSELDIEQGQTSTDVRVPDGNGTLAISGDTSSKSFQLPAYVEGSYEMTIPEGHRTSNFLFGSVNPGGYDREIVDDQEHLTWEEVDSTVSVRYYNSRDIPLFIGLVTIAVIFGGAGMVYVYYQLKQLQERRQEMGIDIEIDDDDDDSPPGFG